MVDMSEGVWSWFSLCFFPQDGPWWTAVVETWSEEVWVCFQFDSSELHMLHCTWDPQTQQSEHRTNRTNRYTFLNFFLSSLSLSGPPCSLHQMPVNWSWTQTQQRGNSNCLKTVWRNDQSWRLDCSNVTYYVWHNNRVTKIPPTFPFVRGFF